MAQTDTSGKGFSDRVVEPALLPTPPVPVLSSESMTSQPSFKLTPPQPSTQTDGMVAYLGEQNKQYANQLTEQAKLFQQPVNDLGNQISQLLQEPGKTSLTAQQYENQGVNTAQTELKDINNQILSEQVALQRRLETMEKNPQGLESGALQDEMQRVKDESLKRQADLSVVQLSKQGRFDSAKEIADRAVAALTEARENKLNALNFLYSENKDLFTKAEQRAFEASQTQRQGELDFERDKLKAELNDKRARSMLEFEQQIKQSDPLYALQIAKLRKEISLLGEPTATERKASAEALKEAQSSVPVMQDKINAVDLLKQHPGLNSRVGTTGFSRGAFAISDTLSGAGQDFAGGIHKLTGGLTLDNLIAAKARGATFGALSEGELKILADSATALNDWEIKDDKGVGTGRWNIDENSFRKELDTIKQLTQRALVQSGQGLFDSDEDNALNELFNSSINTAASYY